jgi:hypothetical protein
MLGDTVAFVKGLALARLLLKDTALYQTAPEFRDEVSHLPYIPAIQYLEEEEDEDYGRGIDGPSLSARRDADGTRTTPTPTSSLQRSFGGCFASAI